jgi:Zn-dependent M28 family amino/carboxypeptidase
MQRSFAWIVPAALVLACSPGESDTANQLEPALAAISAESLMAHTRVLSSDAYQGRAPGTPGEDSTVAYLEARFRELGLAPGNPDGTYIQNVGLIGFSSTPRASFSIGGRQLALNSPNDFVAVSRHDRPQVEVTNSDIVFVGYGVVAPEYGWDDYKDVDVRGKTIVMLVNDPAIRSASDSTRLDETMFKGKAMTYYGRWTYKYEIATAKGAAAAIIVHETEPAGYPYEVVVGSWGRENLDIDPPDSSRVAVEAWIHLDKARELFAAAGQDFDDLKRQALNRDFRPVALGGTATFSVANTVRRIQSRNVVARLEGSDSASRDEVIVYTAHWDHLGVDSTATGDQIFNGALDNASGTAALLELARAFKTLPTAPKRSIVFLAVTAEEKGLLGAKYYAENPLYPLERTVANINIDGVNQWGRTRDIVIVGMGASTMDDELTAVARRHGRTIVPDPEPEKGFFYRSDQFELAKQGVPVLYTDTGVEYVGRDSAYGETMRAEYTAKDYHKPSDEIKPNWDLSGAVDDLRLLLEVGFNVAQASAWPTWKEGAEFKARRDSMLAR